MSAGRTGKVLMIGAGPGDLELLTLKAVRLLGEADIALIDNLVNPEIRRFLKPGAIAISVGKKCGSHSTPQSTIQAQMIELARSGYLVARVKGGDPLIFGRAGEEMAALADAGIETEVISGITSAQGVAAALGISLTHRDHSHSVTFVTGHCQQGTEPNWKQLAKSGCTLVIYMGITRAEHIVGQLLAAGLAGSTPAAAVQHGTLPGETRLLGTLSELPGLIGRANMGSPALIIIGDVLSPLLADDVRGAVTVDFSEASLAVLAGRRT